MGDRHIDHDETKIYGDYAVNKLRSRVVGLIPEYDAALKYVASELEEATQAVSEAVADARGADAEVRKGTRARGSVLKQSVSLLGRFSKHLDAHAAGTIDRKSYFVADGTAGGIGKSVPRVLRALQHMTKKLKDKNTPVKGAAEWAKDFSEAASKLAPLAEHGDNAKTDRSLATPEVEAARQGWLTTYGAAKLTAEAALRLLGKVHVMPKIFFDLAMPSNAKVTEAPVDDGEPIDEPDADGETPENLAGGTSAKPA